MMGMIDMHCHIIPGVDDGAQTKAEVRKMLRMEYNSGVRTLILTPHYRKGLFEPPKELVAERAQQVMHEIKRMQLDMKVYLGCEYHANADMLADVQENPNFRMNGGRYVLVEFHETHTMTRIRNWIYQLVAGGFCPIIAHVERYPQVMENMEYVEELMELGALIQVDASALIGKDGFRLKRVARNLLKKEYIHFIGSDAHDTKVCYPNLDLCRKYVEKKKGKEYAQEIFVTNPRKLLEN